MKNLAIIPARGGSKRIPRKNIKDFLGKPIIAYSIETALQSGLFQEVMVSTDNEDIAAIAKQYGAKIPFIRTNKNADDFATLADVVEEVVQNYDKLGKNFDYYCCILATNPLLQIINLKKGYEQLIHSSFASVRPIVKFGYPVQRAFKLKNGKVDFFYPKYKTVRSQDMEPAYHDAGQFYWMRKDGLLSHDNKGGFEIPDYQVQDIDNETDWYLAELKYNFLLNNKLE
ncbi:MAG: pseudaminic acid cytidylyltransferase [Bacteroidales bacterium]|nr:pseudaminic acid cytidylyltransferase [Bacteroidales bacterium]